MAEYEVIFPSKAIATRDDYDRHAHELDQLRQAIVAELRRIDQLCKAKDLKCVKRDLDYYT